MDGKSNFHFEVEWAAKRGDLVKIRRYNYDGELSISYGVILSRENGGADLQIHLMPYAKVLDFGKRTIEDMGPQLLEIISAA
jgi:hypothetical protein|tara:strand:- start:185 stop:430 length:246 start_codon:yes stop_codon:yes gene_type:complete